MSLSYFFNNLPVSLHLIFSALFPIYTGAHSSLTRPSTAGKESREERRSRRSSSTFSSSSSDSDDEEQDHDSSTERMEGLSPSDALIFPLLAGVTLSFLYVIIKYFGARVLNKALAVYFSFMAIFSTARMFSDGLRICEKIVWPITYSAISNSPVSTRKVWRIKQRERKVVLRSDGDDKKDEVRVQPLPGNLLGSLRLSPFITNSLWTLRGLPNEKYTIRFHIQGLTSFRSTVRLRMIISTIAAIIVIIAANLVRQPSWILTNIQAFAFSYTALQLLSPTTFTTGSLILCALFFYDIYFVFYTPLMVTVAQNLDVPIKMLFPRPSASGQGRNLAMLGLGDVVLPGIIIGLALRFDLYMKYKKMIRYISNSSDDDKKGIKEVKRPYRRVTGRWGEMFWNDRSDESTGFSKIYFYASVMGYILGMSVTLLMNHVFQHAQPALLYLVPGVLLSLWGTAYFRGEVDDMWNYTEGDDDDNNNNNNNNNNSIKSKSENENILNEKKEESAKEIENSWTEMLQSFFAKSFFSNEKAEKNARMWEKNLAKSLDLDIPKDETRQTSQTRSSSNAKNHGEAWFGLSISRYKGKQRDRGRKLSRDGEVKEPEKGQSTAVDIKS